MLQVIISTRLSEVRARGSVQHLPSSKDENTPPSLIDLLRKTLPPTQSPVDAHLMPLKETRIQKDRKTSMRS